MHVYVDTTEPGNTAMTASVTFDDSTWHSMTEVTGDRLQLSDSVIQRHFKYDTHTSAQQYVRTRLNLSTTVTSVSPAAADVRVIASASA